MNHARAVRWSQDEFGDADIGDERRVRRLVQMAAAGLVRPAGMVTEVFSTSSGREGAYRLLENPEVVQSELTAAAGRAAARRCKSEKTVVVPMDGSSLNLRDPSRRRGLGPVGARASGAQGVLVMTSLAVDMKGATLGVLDQHYWTRSQGASLKSQVRRRAKKKDRRPRDQRESFLWVKCMRRVVGRMSVDARETTAWFQLDRGADCMEVLMEAADAKLCVTVRAIHDRCVRWPNGTDGRLLTSMARRPVAGTYTVDVPARPNQTERTATMALRSARIPLELKVGTKRRRVLEMDVVLATEQHAPHGQTPLRWLLFTTRPVATVGDLRIVVSAYALRWRVEDFHKTWKSNACNIEASKLGSKDAILRWATIMASVATRIEHIKHAARTTPDRPATELFTRDEIDATILLYSAGLTKIKVPYRPGDTPTVAEAVRWIASLGGHMGNTKTRPPGTKVLARGLAQVAAVARVLAAQRDA